MLKCDMGLSDCKSIERRCTHMNFPRTICMIQKEDGGVYWSIEEVLYKGARGTASFIHCASEMDDNCENCTLFNDCNRLIEKGEELLQ